MLSELLKIILIMVLTVLFIIIDIGGIILIISYIKKKGRQKWTL